MQVFSIPGKMALKSDNLRNYYMLRFPGSVVNILTGKING